MPAPPPPPPALLLISLNDTALVFIPSTLAMTTGDPKLESPEHTSADGGLEERGDDGEDEKEESRCHFTSVYVYTLPSAHQRRTQIDTEEAYTKIQAEISILLSKLVLQHLHDPFPSHVRSLIIDGEGYELRCDLKPWPYGKTIDLSWGTTRLVPTREKWQVGFRMVG